MSNWKQYFYDTGNPEIKKVGRTLRNMGYKVKVSSMGNQVTKVGIIKMTMITVYNADDRLPYIQDISI